MTETVEFTESSGNVFRDLQMDDAAYLLVKADLLGKIRELITEDIASPEQIADKLKLHTSEFDLLMRSHTTDRFTMRQLFKILELLGYEARLSFQKIAE